MALLATINARRAIRISPGSQPCKPPHLDHVQFGHLEGVSGNFFCLRCLPSLPSLARSGQESIAQGLPWVTPLTRISPEGATRYGENRCRIFEPDRVLVSSPFRAKRLYRLTQGKPWAKLSWPVGPKTRRYPHPSSRHISKLQAP
jgi:hypothetical protein